VKRLLPWLALFRIRTFRASVIDNYFTRLGIGGIPFLFPLLHQGGLAFTPIQSGLLKILMVRPSVADHCRHLFR